MATPIIEGIDNEVLFVVSVFVAVVAIFLVHLLQNSNINFSLDSWQNTAPSDSVDSSPSQQRAQENLTEQQGRK